MYNRLELPISRQLLKKAAREASVHLHANIIQLPTPAGAQLDGTILRGLVHLEPPNSRLHRLALYLAIPGVSAGTYGFPNDHQITAPFAERLEASLAAAAQRRRRRRHRDLGDLRDTGRGLRCETAERLADDAVTLARPNSGGAMMMMMPLFPPVGGRVGGGERETRSTLTLTVQNKIEGVVRIDAATVARAVGRDFGYGVAAAIAALLLGLAEDEHGRALEHLTAASRHRVGGGCATLLNTTAGV